MLHNNESDTMKYYYKNTVENEKVLEGNGKIWNSQLDKTLREIVVVYNFNFAAIAEIFKNLFGKKIDRPEEEIKRHWAFLHAARHVNLTVNEEYYKQIRKNFLEDDDVRTEKVLDIIKNEEEEKIKMQRENEKFRNDRFNLITLGTEEDFKKNENKNQNIIEENLTDEIINIEHNENTIPYVEDSIINEVDVTEKEFYVQSKFENLNTNATVNEAVKESVNETAKEIDELFEQAKNNKNFVLDNLEIDTKGI